MSAKLDAALAYARLGWRVLPLHSAREGRCSCGREDCKSPAKHPHGLLAASGVKDATSDEETIRRWWRAEPEANVAVATGRASGVVVLDRDDGHGGEGTLKRVVEAIGEATINQTPTATAITGQGKHYYFRHPGAEDLRNWQGRDDLPGLDFRGDGGYVVAPPSTHISGRAYSWQIRPEEKIAALPDFVVQLAQGRRLEAAAPPHEWVREALKGVAEGARHATACRLAGHWFAEGYDHAMVLANLKMWNSRNSPPLDMKELKRIADNINRADAGQRRNFEIEKIEKLEVWPPIYRVGVFGQTVKMDIDHLVRYSLFVKRVTEATNRMPIMKRASDWQTYISGVLESKLVVVDAPQEASEGEMLWNSVARHLSMRRTQDVRGLSDRSGDVYDNGQILMFEAMPLINALRARNFKVTPHEVWDLIRQKGGAPLLKKVRRRDGTPILIRLWAISNAVLEEPFALDDEEAALGDETDETTDKEGST